MALVSFAVSPASRDEGQRDVGARSGGGVAARLRLPERDIGHLRGLV